MQKLAWGQEYYTMKPHLDLFNQVFIVFSNVKISRYMLLLKCCWFLVCLVLFVQVCKALNKHLPVVLCRGLGCANQCFT